MTLSDSLSGLAGYAGTWISFFQRVGSDSSFIVHLVWTNAVIIRCLFLIVFFCLPFGCAGIGTSKWANDDPIYAEKYASNYSSNDGEKAARMLKQAVDARHVAGRNGVYAGFAGASDPGTAGAEIGGFTYVHPAMEIRGGLKGVLGTGANDWFAGLDLGTRLQAPSRLAPFVGVGTFVGWNGNEVGARNDFIDNDGDGAIDELGETKDQDNFLASVYPEVGVHFWLDSKLRMTGSAQYHVTTEGRDSDFWFFGVTFSWLNSADSVLPEAIPDSSS